MATRDFLFWKLLAALALAVAPAFAQADDTPCLDAHLPHGSSPVITLGDEGEAPFGFITINEAGAWWLFVIRDGSPCILDAGSRLALRPDAITIEPPAASHAIPRLDQPQLPAEPAIPYQPKVRL